jgi:hypothetical protein
MFTVPYSKDCPDRNHPQCHTEHKRIALEVKYIRVALRELRADGWMPYKTNDGMETIKTPTNDAVLETVFSVDVSNVAVRNSVGTVSWFQVVLGNGIDCIPDSGTLIAPSLERAYDIFETYE